MRKDDQLIPDRSALSPAAFKEFLPGMSILEMDFENRVMPVRLVGETIKEFYGYDLNGLDYTTVENTPDPGLIWESRRSYHDLPRGLYTEFAFKFDEHYTFQSSITTLPLWGTKGETLLVAFQEFDQMHIRRILDRPAPKNELPSHIEFIDVGAGIPTLPPEAIDTILHEDGQVSCPSRSD